jgi:hypothetical protein
MEDEIEDIWPLPHYNPGGRLHLHALGVIDITYASFGQSIERLYSWSDRADYLQQNSKDRSHYLIEKFRDQEPGLVKPVRNIVEYFDVCTWNRNQLLHAERYPAAFGGDGQSLYLTKPSAKGGDENRYFKIELSELRLIADQMHAGFVKCADVHIYRRFGSWPESVVPRNYKPYVSSGPPTPILLPQKLILRTAPPK